MTYIAILLVWFSGAPHASNVTIQNLPNAKACAAVLLATATALRETGTQIGAVNCIEAVRA